MKISGFSFVRNAVLYDYPFLESIQSILPLCDEFVIAVGKSEDDTLSRIASLHNSKIKIIETEWDASKKKGGIVLAEQTNIALRGVTGDWAFYLQADEVVHEKDIPTIRQALEQCLSNRNIEGLLFNYKHFYGSYRYVGNSRRWYRREIRIVRTGIGAQSWRDAQGFRIDSRKIRARLVDATVYHYGWVKPPKVQQMKQLSFNRLWHSDDWIDEHVMPGVEFDYSNGGRLEPFQGTHPAVMKNRTDSENWDFLYDPHKLKRRKKEIILDWIESKTGYRLAEYKNYDLV